MPTYTINTQTCRQVAADIMGSGSKIEADLSQQATEINSLMASWTGEDKLAYEGYKTKWQQLCSEMAAILRDHAGPALERICENVETTERGNTQSFSS